MNQRNLEASVGTIPTGTGYCKVLTDLKTLLEGLCGEGEETVIHKAILKLQVFYAAAIGNPTDVVIQPVVMVADAALASAVAPAVKDVDEILDVATAGNFEFKFLGEPFTLPIRILDNAGAAVLQSMYTTIDFTAVLRKAAQRLVRSAMLTTNPEIRVVLAVSSGASYTIQYTVATQIDYTVRPRTARMI